RMPIGPLGNLPLERLNIRASLMPQRFWPDSPHARIADLVLLHVGFTLRLDPRELQLIAQDRRQLVQRDINLQDMRRRVAAGLTFATLAVRIAGRNRLTDLA